MGLGRPPTQGMWMYLVVAAAVVAVILLCCLAQMGAVKRHGYNEVVFAPPCAQDPLPEYGSRQAPETYCAG
jgi:hypothetical protein